MYIGGDIVRDGLVLHLDAGSERSYPKSGTIWKDLSGNRNDGTLVNNVSFSNNVMSFDGTDDHVLIGNSNTYNSITNLTIESLVKFKRVSSYEYIVSNARDCCGTYNGYELRMSSNSRLTFSLWNSSAVTLTSSTTMNLETFYHIVATYDGTVMKLYVNSTLNNSLNTTAGIGTPATYNLRVGAMGLSGIYELLGDIGFVKIYNRALTADEVEKNYNATKKRFGL